MFVVCLPLFFNVYVRFIIFCFVADMDATEEALEEEEEYEVLQSEVVDDFDDLPDIAPTIGNPVLSTWAIILGVMTLLAAYLDQELKYPIHEKSIFPHSSDSLVG